MNLFAHTTNLRTIVALAIATSVAAATGCDTGAEYELETVAGGNCGAGFVQATLSGARNGSVRWHSANATCGGTGTDILNLEFASSSDSNLDVVFFAIALGVGETGTANGSVTVRDVDGNTYRGSCSISIHQNAEVGGSYVASGRASCGELTGAGGSLRLGNVAFGSPYRAFR